MAGVDAVFSLFETIGSLEYVSEGVTETQHMIQAAMNAEAEGQPTQVVLGTLLHDIGMLVGREQGAEKVIVQNVDIGPKDHDLIGEQFLKKHGFPPEIYCFTSGHVGAIRYMAYKDPAFKDTLPWSSQQTLERRGGPYSEAEAKQFEQLPHYEAILKCRMWDEQAKDASRKLEPLDKYKAMAKDYLSTK
jgi:predicted HD phosphohydrolase